MWLDMWIPNWIEKSQKVKEKINATMATVTEEIAAVEAGIKKLDKAVAELKATICSKVYLLTSLDSAIDAMVETLKEEQKI